MQYEEIVIVLGCCSSNDKGCRNFDSEFWNYSDNDAQQQEEDISDSDGNYPLKDMFIESICFLLDPIRLFSRPCRVRRHFL